MPISSLFRVSEAALAKYGSRINGTTFGLRYIKPESFKGEVKLSILPPIMCVRTPQIESFPGEVLFSARTTVMMKDILYGLLKDKGWLPHFLQVGKAAELFISRNFNPLMAAINKQEKNESIDLSGVAGSQFIVPIQFPLGLRFLCGSDIPLGLDLFSKAWVEFSVDTQQSKKCFLSYKPTAALDCLNRDLIDSARQIRE